MFGRADLTIRQFERSDVMLEGEFEVAAEHRAQVAFSGRHAAMIDARTMRIAVADIGAGGIGFQAPVFLPRMLCGIVRIFDLRGHGDSEASPVRCIAFEHAVRIRRCELASRAPSYLIGSSFENADESIHPALSRFMDRIAVSMRRVAELAGDEPAHKPEADGA